MSYKTINLNDKDIAFLESLKPFPEIVEKLNDMIANNYRQNWNEPQLNFKDMSAGRRNLFSEKRTPELEIAVIGRPRSISNIPFKVSILLPDCDMTCDGQSDLDRLMSSRFNNYFSKDRLNIYYAPLSMDVITAARFMTYHLSIFGYTNPSDFKIGMILYFTIGSSPHKMYIPPKIIVPGPLRRAIAKIKELKIDNNVHIRISGPSDGVTNESLYLSYCDFLNHLSFENKIQDRAEVDRRLTYRNVNCLRLMACGYGYEESFSGSYCERNLLFITDYFLFLNPAVRNEEIVVSLDFSVFRNTEQDGNRHREDGCEDLSDWLFSFYPDGNEEAPVKLKRLLDEVEKYYEKLRRKEPPTLKPGTSDVFGSKFHPRPPLFQPLRILSILSDSISNYFNERCFCIQSWQHGIFQMCTINRKLKKT